MSSLQRNYEWHEQRRGKFTASAIYQLMGQRGLGKTGETYILEKVTEELGVEIPQYEDFRMRYGIEMEPFAKEYYQQAFDCEIEEQPFLIADWCSDAGCSPDGIIKKRQKGIEIKCHYNPVEHTKDLLIKSTDEFKDAHKNWYWQIQMCMVVTGLKSWDFAAFHPEFTGLNRMLVLTIKWNDEDITLLKGRILEAVEMKKQYLDKILN
jgi:Rieske Fe-S protein